MKLAEFKNIGLDEIEIISLKLAEFVKPGFTIGLIGDLGAGKTCLVSDLCKKIKITSGISSPTFTLLNQYETAETHLLINHFDMYRISTFEDLESIGYYDCINDINSFNIIEWADKILKYLPKENLVLIKITYSIDLEKRDYVFYS